MRFNFTEEEEPASVTPNNPQEAVHVGCGIATTFLEYKNTEAGWQ
jgi:hypothetical protein